MTVSGTFRRVGSYTTLRGKGNEIFQGSLREIHECFKDCQVGELAGFDEEGNLLIKITIVKKHD